MIIIDFLTIYHIFFILVYRNKIAPVECEPACESQYSCVSPKVCAEKTGTGELLSLYSHKSKVCCLMVENNVNSTPEIENSTNHDFEVKELTTTKRPVKHFTEYNHFTKLNFKTHRNAYLLPTENCGIGFYDNKVANGEEARLGEYPWMALIGFTEQKDAKQLNFFCGGTLINDYYVLTAAHCVEDGYRPEYVRLGEHDLRKEIDCFPPTPGKPLNRETQCFPPYKDILVEEVIVHEGYKKDLTYRNDIALLRLSQNASETTSHNNFSTYNINSICLPLDPSILRFTDNTAYEMAGWGRTNSKSENISDVLMKNKNPVRTISLADCNDEVCSSGTEKLFCPINENQFCVEGVFKFDICKGDSGGPLMYRRVQMYQLGVVSAKSVDGCGKVIVPSIFTNVVPYISWILDHIKE